jgi:hypothetical protein
MAFNTLYRLRFGDDEQYKKEISLRSLTHEDGGVKHYVDIRTFYVEKDKLKPTTFGVMLTPQEFKSLLPSMISGTPIDIGDDVRKISFARKLNKSYLFILSLKRMDGKDTSIQLILGDINRMSPIVDVLKQHNL